ncbi:MAG: Ycf51 family protein [Pseudanabaenaceae cyanobacterium SKYGB_i_bin29]|nr:Ycf51 family protein [Pseudanabaenaceae cyanobacterium SKYG29]MDW8420618.1 Ycf51 family protein [Pseudanabaenaceae cyanobacterium SKYGB_i_bin29]
MVLTTVEFGQIAQGMGLFVLGCAILTGVAFVKNWGWRFRMVGVTLFSVVLTGGLFALSLTPLTKEVVPGAAPYKTVYDRFGAEAVIAVAPTITPAELALTLEQAAARLFSSGRTSDTLTVYARTIVHPRPGVSKPLYLGYWQQSLRQRNDPDRILYINDANFARLQSLRH